MEGSTSKKISASPATNKTVELAPGLEITGSNPNLFIRFPVVHMQQELVTFLDQEKSSKHTTRFIDAETEKNIQDHGLESFPIFDYANREALRKLRRELERSLNELIETYENKQKLGKNAAIYKKSLEKIGIRYEVDHAGIIH